MFRRPFLRAWVGVTRVGHVDWQHAWAEPNDADVFAISSGSVGRHRDQAGAAGGFTFAASVQDRVIVQTNYSNTPATVASRRGGMTI
jgi:hypothetical protein